MSNHEFMEVNWRDYVDSMQAEKQRALDAALIAQKEAITKAEIATDRIAARAQADQVALREETGERLLSLRREMEAAAAAQKEAVIKAEEATEKRFESVNEWRAQSADRERSQINERSALYAGFVPREVWETQHDALANEVGVLQSRMDTMQGEQAGITTQKDSTFRIMQLLIAALSILVVVATATHGKF